MAISIALPRLSQLALAQANTGAALADYRLYGVVQILDERTGTTIPLTGATVQLISGGDSLRTVVTDSTGRFTVAALPNHRYQLVTEHTGCFTARIYWCPESAPTGPAPPIPPVSQLPLTLTLHRVIPSTYCYIPQWEGFDYNQTRIRPDVARYLDYTVSELFKKPAFYIEVEAHADQRGSAAYNLQLSQRRAEAIKQYLIGKGISPTRIALKAYGETRPYLNQPRTESDYRKNRTVSLRMRKLPMR